MTTRRTRTALAALSLAGALTLAACGGDSGGSDTAATPTTTAGSSAASASPTTVAAAFARVSSATTAKKSVKGTLTTTTDEGKVEGDFAYKFTDAGLLASFTFDSQGKTFNGILTPKAIFIGGADLGLPGGKEYLKVSLDADNELSQTYRDLTEGFTEAGDLQATIDQWKALADLREAGTETIDGVSTTKYVGTVDPANPPAGAPSAAADAFAQAAAAGVTSIETTIWIGPDGLPVQVQNVSEGSTGTSTTVIKYTDWGAAVDVAVPPAGKVADLSGLLSR